MSGFALSVMDGFLAVAAIANGLMAATRNAHFAVGAEVETGSA